MLRLASVSLAVLLGCGGRTVPAPVPAVAPEAAVYAALLDSVYTHPVAETLLVGDRTLRFRAPQGGVSRWRVGFDSLPDGLAATLETASHDPRPTAALPLGRPMEIVTSAALREIFAPGIPRGWEELYRRYPRQRRYLGFSPVAFTADSLDALVYYEYHCGGLCGGGSAVWLTRRARDRWLVRKIVPFWVS